MDARTLTVSQTAYKGKLRDFGKTKKSLAETVHLPEGLATAVAVEAGVSRSLAVSVHLSQCAQAQRVKDERLHPYRQLSRPGAEEAGREAGVGEAEFPSAAAHDGDAGPDQGRHQRRARRFGTQQGRHHGERLHATDRGGREVDARCDLLGADGEGGASGRLVKLARNLVRFGTVEILDGPQVIESKG